MASAPLPDDEAKRLEALRAYGILDTAPERAYDDLARLAGAICATPVALVTLVDEGRQWFKARLGLDVVETPRDVSFCAHAILRDGLFVVDDAFDDSRFADNPLVRGDPFIRFYAGAPLRARGGDRLGTVCVIDHIPRRLTAGQREALSALGRQAEAQLELGRRAAEIAAGARREREAREAFEAARRREERVRRCVHDLKRPLDSVVASAGRLLERDDLGAEVRASAEGIAEAAASLSRLARRALDAD
ncbi:MAG TPA: GAF domain-containing protein [Polyangiaceae bacterium]|nr:GAF domain-containing protein [Polyangiaceae bacterium]